MVTIIFTIMTGAEKAGNLDLSLSNGDRTLSIFSKVPNCLLEKQLTTMHASIAVRDSDFHTMIKALHDTIEEKRDGWRNPKDSKCCWWKFDIELDFPCMLVKDALLPYSDDDSKSKFAMLTMKGRGEVIETVAAWNWE